MREPLIALGCPGATTRTFDGGGADSGESKPPTPNSDFSSDFAHFISERPENPNFLVNIQKIFFKNRDFWGGDILPES